MRYVDSKSPDQVQAEKEKKMGLWRFGKSQYKQFTNYHVKRTTFIKTTVFGILISLLVLLPFILVLIALYKVFAYNPFWKIGIMVAVYLLLLIYNGISNYYTVQITKKYITDDEKLQKFDAWAICYYNILNPLFMIFAFFIIIFLLIGGFSC